LQIRFGLKQPLSGFGQLLREMPND
jgi:hypothetical protein